MTDESFDTRLDAVLSMLTRVAALDFSVRLRISKEHDQLDAIASGLNMLSEELEASVIQRSRLAEINEDLERFAYVAAHDIQSPLFVSGSLAHILAEELEGQVSEEVEKHLDMLKAANAHMDRLLKGILEYSRIGIAHVPMAEVDLGVLCAEVASQYALDDRMVITFDESLPVVLHHPIALRQILENLVGNAIKYTDKAMCRVGIRCVERADSYEVSVEDNGPGIPEEKTDRLFDLFENLGGADATNSGIGLATAKKLVTGTGGRLWFEPVASGGARFLFTIIR